MLGTEEAAVTGDAITESGGKAEIFQEGVPPKIRPGFSAEVLISDGGSIS